MGRVGYDYLGGYLRMAKAAEHLDARVTQIILLHTALEREIDIVLAKLLPRPDKLGDLTFFHKSNLLNAAWIGPPEAAERVCEVLLQFNSLRNAVAHQMSDKIDVRIKALVASYKKIDPSASDQIEVGEIAQGVCAYLGDGPMPEDMAKILASLAKLGAALK